MNQFSKNIFIVISLACISSFYFLACKKNDTVLPKADTVVIKLPNGTNIGEPSGGTGTTRLININFTATPPCAPAHEEFVFTCTGAQVPTDAIIEWYFGDGGSDKGKTVIHAYDYKGYYKVEVKVKKANGEIIGSTNYTVGAWGQGVTPMADFYTTPDTQTPIVVKFNSNSNVQHGSIDSYEWDFGDGTTGSGSFIQHEFPKMPFEKKYSVTLTVKSTAGCESKKTIQVPVLPTYNISGGITYSSTSPCEPSSEEFTFTAPTFGVPQGATYEWDFADGNVATGNPVKKRFAYTNTYDVKVKIKYQGYQIYNSNIPIVCMGQSVTPVAAFNAVIRNFEGNEFNFNSSSTVRSGASLIKFFWDFGDGTTATGINVNKVYTRQATEKKYIVKLTVWATTGCSNTATDTVIVPKL